MNTNIYLEIFGYIGTALVVISMMMSSVTKLRIVNMSGSVISAIYAGICGTWPIVVMNVCLFAINGFHLTRAAIAKKKKIAEGAENTDISEDAENIDILEGAENIDISEGAAE